MRRKIGATTEDIAKAVTLSWSTGQPPTLRSMAAHLGYAGNSFSHIHVLVRRALREGKIVIVASDAGRSTIWTPSLLASVTYIATHQDQE